MGKKFAPITPKFPHMLHGGDYNPDQWKDYPEVLTQDIELMKKAHINCVSLGIFSWAQLEPKKDVFDFEWMDKTIDRLYENGIYVNLATPSGARPHWLADEYPEVLRVDEKGIRAHFGARHNHCYTSPAYRERVTIIDTKLAQRYAKHPGVIMWHISNEFGGECRCGLCQEAFRNYLKKKYKDIEELNHAWWARFWSHTYSDFSEIEAPGEYSETAINGLWLDWWRFVTYQTIDFMKVETAAVKSVDPSIPVTTNFMGLYDGLNYPEFADELDVLSWDSYPDWHGPNRQEREAYMDSFIHDYIRSMKKQPFVLMECTPSTVNWRSVSKMKKPGMHRLAVLNAVAHGSESGMYFQIRQSRGSAEKIHSAVISHTGTENTRVFREVAQLGADLEKISDKIYGSDSPAKVAIIEDKESKWALDQSNGPRNQGFDYHGMCGEYYKYFWANGINVDVVNSKADFSGYSLVIAPMLYMYHDDIQEKLREFVNGGGIMLTTALSGIVQENDLCFLGEATEEKMSDVLGMWVEEYDGLYDEEYNETILDGKTYRLKEICEVIHPTTAQVLSTYEKDYYKGSPVFTVNSYGKGRAYHLAANASLEMIEALCGRLAAEAGLKCILGRENIQKGIGIAVRENTTHAYIFIENFMDEAQMVDISKSSLVGCVDILTEKAVSESLELPAFSLVIIEKKLS